MVFPKWAPMYDGRRNRRASEVLFRIVSGDPGFPDRCELKTFERVAVKVPAVYTEDPPAVRIEVSDITPAVIEAVSASAFEDLFWATHLKKTTDYYLIRCSLKGFSAWIEFLHEIGHLLQDLGFGLTRPVYTERFPPAYREANELEATAWAYTILAMAFPELFEKQAREGLLVRPFIPFMPPLDYSFGGAFVKSFKPKSKGKQGTLFRKKERV